jgi:hypothetical protein
MKLDELQREAERLTAEERRKLSSFCATGMVTSAIAFSDYSRNLVKIHIAKEIFPGAIQAEERSKF